MQRNGLTCEELVKNTHQVLEGLNQIELKLVLAMVEMHLEAGECSCCRCDGE